MILSIRLVRHSVAFAIMAPDLTWVRGLASICVNIRATGNRWIRHLTFVPEVDSGKQHEFFANGYMCWQDELVAMLKAIEDYPMTISISIECHFFN